MHRYILLSILISLVLILLGMSRGFDISDEGLYALLAVPDQENVAGIFNYDLFFKLLHKVLGVEFGLIGLRILRLLSCFVSAFALAFFWNNFTGSSKNGWIKFLISLCGVFASYGFLPQTLSYNSINLMCGCMWLAVISYRSLDTRKVVLLGFILALLFYSKITVCFLLGLLTLIILWKAKGSRKMLKWLIVLAIPLLIVELLFFRILGDSGILRALEAKGMLAFRPDYHFLSLAKYTFVGFLWSSIVILPFLLAGYLNRIGSPFSKWAFIFGICVLILVSYATTITDEINHIVLLSTAAATAYCLLSGKSIKLDFHQKALLTLLFAFPFILHFGSNVYFLRLGIHYWGFWMIALLIIRELEYKSNDRINFGVAIMTVILIGNGIWINPFEQESLWLARRKWIYKKGKEIKLTSDQITLLQTIEPFVSGQRELLALYRIPGITYLLGKMSPKSPGFWDSNQLLYFMDSSDQLDCILLYPKDSLPSIFKGDFSKKNIQAPMGDQIQILWRK